jgi:predicted unusual protein kinase regulating ubiquinone biosynthesis (AarF/ABC1/UbiB family)
MQTDPNWSNFLYNPKTRRVRSFDTCVAWPSYSSISVLQIELIDFGASREYSKEFMDDWYLLLRAATLNDASVCHEYSLKLGYLTGDENEASVASAFPGTCSVYLPSHSPPCPSSGNVECAYTQSHAPRTSLQSQHATTFFLRSLVARPYLPNS